MKNIRDVATSYSNLASVYYSIGEYSQAKELNEKALTIRKKIFGERPSRCDKKSYGYLVAVNARIAEITHSSQITRVGFTNNDETVRLWLCSFVIVVLFEDR